MANKRNLKKFMKTMAESIAGETVFILNFYDNIDEDKAEKVIDDLAMLLNDKIADVSVCFDKTPVLSFDRNKKEYRKARRTYFKTAYNKLLQDFNDGLKPILKEMNGLLSKEQLEQNKKFANE